MANDLSILGEFEQNPHDFVVRPITRFATIGATVDEILRLNPMRVGYRVVNRDVADAAWSFVPDFTFANGDILAASGGSIQTNWKDDREICVFPVYAIRNAADVLVRIHEFVLQRR